MTRSSSDTRDDLADISVLSRRALGAATLAIIFAATSTTAQRGPASAPTAAAQRALLDQYCVTCHNDRLKTSNLSLEKLDLAAVGDHTELWERVVRKLRAGVMPPPGVRRPALA